MTDNTLLLVVNSLMSKVELLQAAHDQLRKDFNELSGWEEEPDAKQLHDI
jgi:hypothetical protein